MGKNTTCLLALLLVACASQPDRVPDLSPAADVAVRYLFCSHLATCDGGPGEARTAKVAECLQSTRELSTACYVCLATVDCGPLSELRIDFDLAALVCQPCVI